MKYKVTNIIQTSSGELKLIAIYDDFENVIAKVIRDLQSMWKDIIIMLNMKIERYNGEEVGVKLWEDGKLIAKNEGEVREALEVISINNGHFKQTGSIYLDGV
tara:strand:+ start:1285 stop:1593 length:309 start_codon:yes stop_codon:yes gene_type:complete